MRTKMIALLGLGLAALGAFQNCSSGNLPSTETTASAAATPDMVLSTMTVSPVTQTLAVGSTAYFTIDWGNVSSVSYVCTSDLGARIAGGNLPMGQASLPIQVAQAFRCDFTATGNNVVPTEPKSASVSLPVAAAPAPAPTPTPTAPVAPDQLWTWRGNAFQTACYKNGTCDGAEWASCVGVACAAPRVQCYNAVPPGQSLHPVGTTQLTQPDGFLCYLRNANDPWVTR